MWFLSNLSRTGIEIQNILFEYLEWCHFCKLVRLVALAETKVCEVPTSFSLPLKAAYGIIGSSFEILFFHMWYEDLNPYFDGG